MKAKYISQAWLVLLLSLSFGAALAGVDVWLAPRIEANKLAATLNEIENLVPGANKAASAECEPLKVTVGRGKSKSDYEVFWAVDAKNKPLGWVIKASGSGFADKIELLVGVDSRCRTITGMAVLDQKETPGLGNKIANKGTEEKKGFLWQFDYYDLHAYQPLTVTTASPKKGDYNKIKAVTGATISSRSVCNIVNEALGKPLRDALVAELKNGPTTRPTEKE